VKFERYGLGLVKGMMITLRHLARHPVVTQFPEQRLHISRRSRGNELIWSREKCTGCATCAKACPQGAIEIVTSTNTETNKYDVETYRVDTGYCIQCGLCVEACPYDAVYLGYSFERARYRREDLVQEGDGMAESAARPVSAYFHPELAEKLPRQTLLVEKIVEKDD
jgi:NADH-quinone oxidoreductase chain I